MCEAGCCPITAAGLLVTAAWGKHLTAPDPLHHRHTAGAMYTTPCPSPASHAVTSARMGDTQLLKPPVTR